jgi:hypothetical protein
MSRPPVDPPGLTARREICLQTGDLAVPCDEPGSDEVYWPHRKRTEAEHA